MIRSGSPNCPSAHNISKGAQGRGWRRRSTTPPVPSRPRKGRHGHGPWHGRPAREEGAKGGVCAADAGASGPAAREACEWGREGEERSRGRARGGSARGSLRGRRQRASGTRCAHRPGHGAIDDARDVGHYARAVEAPFRGGRPEAAWPMAATPASGSGKVRSAAGDEDEAGRRSRRASWFA